eukprot:CAMPEP_0171466122 /NCGR_PEP_ID=MMETSP0945-20130129/9003_1 /TAXON_ID=109269 /ORGANISM="Vaucheria litorea, Strain CCMP2940" /LENGTH=150 /DNA_ID=CAMNT_0011994019 /DNA_START=85 /DNA_END=533 /DNA_ORIENTATION=+
MNFKASTFLLALLSNSIRTLSEYVVSIDSSGMTTLSPTPDSYSLQSSAYESMLLPERLPNQASTPRSSATSVSTNGNETSDFIESDAGLSSSSSSSSSGGGYSSSSSSSSGKMVKEYVHKTQVIVVHKPVFKIKEKVIYVEKPYFKIKEV